ncbi:EAL domain-containing protein [Cohnella suwonensis]|uniref:EAL domain-containing protein n=1 Tax=Cohnella suwonensis TaxID=696072 RepID=A0ABW0LQL9_9BACL
MRPRSILPLWRPRLLMIGGYLLLVLLSFVSEYNAVPWFYGYQIGFGSVFLLVVLLIYGLAWGLPAAVCIYGSLALLGETTWIQTLPQLAFIAVTGLLLRKFPDKLILIACFYWLLAGLPLDYLLYVHETDYQDGLGYLFGLNGALNSLISALAADMILSYSPIRRWLAPGRARSGYAFNRIVLHLTLVATTVPFFIFILINGYQAKDAVMDRARNNLDTQASIVNRDLTAWTETNYRSLRLMGALQLRKLQNDMRINAESMPPTKLVLLDSEGRAVSVVGTDAPLIGETFDWRIGGKVQVRNSTDSLWLPEARYPYSSEMWRYAYLVRESSVGNGNRAVFLMPFSPYMEEPVKSFISYIRLLLLFVAVTMMLTLLLNRLFFRSLTRLAEATTGIPDKVSLDGSLDWPTSDISEIRMLTENFRSVADNLAAIFRQTKSANNQLNLQKEQLALSEKRLFQLAYYDHLTGLPNRLSMKERLTKELEAAASSGWSACLSVLFIDLDRFKHVNDTLGHIVGDDLLCLVSERLSREQSDHTFIARISGDEFVILLNHADPDDAVRTSARIIEQFGSPFLLHGHSLYVTPSIGMATSPHHGRDIDTLMKNADSAMYAAKENGGKGFIVYSEALNGRISKSMWLENNLHQALIDNKFELYYQMKIDSVTGVIAGMEALVRWRHPERGFIPPSEFIPVAEETGLIIPLGDWILRTACEQNVKWHKAGHSPLRIAVNLSARQFHNPRLVETICDILAETGMPSRYLELEITEGYLLKNEDYVVGVLQHLRELGVYISIDDFGTGYSSLSQLKRFPVQAVKIDKSFIQGMDSDSSNDSIVKAVIQLAHSMNLKVVAEGVETTAEEGLLRRYGCDEFQGYLFGRPMPAAAFEACLAGMPIIEPGR